MNVLMLLKCNGLKYDDRVRKEALSLEKIGYKVCINVVENDNTKGSGFIFSERINYIKHSLITRRFIPGNKLLFVKMLELFFRVLPLTLKKNTIVWLHDPIMFVFVPYFYFIKKLGLVDKIVWDQHELPPEKFLNSKLLQPLYKFSMSLADVKIHANEERALYLNNKIEKEFDYEVLRNFIDEDFLSEEVMPLENDVASWLSQDEYYLLQSGAYESRNFSNVVSAICNKIKAKCVVVGGFDTEYISKLRSSYSNFDDYFFLVGMVDQIRLVDYIERAKASVIFYDDKEVNSLYCEPNRLYQAIGRGCPVIVGNNPTMKNIVERLSCGVVVSDSGNSPENIITAFLAFTHSDVCVTREAKKEFVWSAQSNVFSQFM